MARIIALLALVVLSLVPGPAASAAADQPQAVSGDVAKAKPGKPAPTKPAPGKPAPAKPKKPKPGAKAPAQKPPEAKPVSPAPLPPAAKPPEAKPPDTKPGDAKAEVRPTPRFASLRAEKVYLRAGPGPDFPILWVFARRGLPVEILAVFDIYRKVRDSEGAVGWVNQQMLTGRRSVLVTGAIRDLHGEATATSEVVAQLEPGVVAAVSKCEPAWCEVKAGGYKGWLKRDEVWGLEADEVIQ